MGFSWGDLNVLRERYQRLKDGWNTMPDGEEVFYVSNPALGLWCRK